MSASSVTPIWNPAWVRWSWTTRIRRSRRWGVTGRGSPSSVTGTRRCWRSWRSRRRWMVSRQSRWGWVHSRWRNLKCSWGMLWSRIWSLRRRWRENIQVHNNPSRAVTSIIVRLSSRSHRLESSSSWYSSSNPCWRHRNSSSTSNTNRTPMR